MAADLPKPPAMANSISVFVCEHGSLYLRLLDRDGHIFAVACMDRATGLELVDDIVIQFETTPTMRCDGVH